MGVYEYDSSLRVTQRQYMYGIVYWPAVILAYAAASARAAEG